MTRGHTGSGIGGGAPRELWCVTAAARRPPTEPGATLLKLAEATYPGSKPLSYETELYADLGEVHEVEVETAEGQHCEVAAGSDGGLIYTECRIDAAELPAPVREAVSAAAPGAEILEAERLDMAIGEQQYSVELKHEGRELYLQVTAGGELLSKHLLAPTVLELPLD